MGVDDINVLMARAQAEAARKLAIERAQQAEAGDDDDEPLDIELPSGTGILQVNRRQGHWRCYLAGERIRSGDELEVYVNHTVGWVRGRLQWARSPHTPPSIRLGAEHPEARGRDGEPLNLGEIELLLPEEALCRWPPGDS
jgi:hypothetical protein